MPTIPIRIRSRPAGLTLVELLVTFVILSLLVGLVLEGLSLFTARYETVTRHFRTAASQTLGQQWFATSVRGIVPYGRIARRFQGDAKSFTGITLEPLHAEPGTPVTVRWSVASDEFASTVVYAEYAAIIDPATATPIVEWHVHGSEDASLSFQYAAGVPGVASNPVDAIDAAIDAALARGTSRSAAPPAKWQDRWLADGAETARTPRLVRLVADDDEVVWTGHVEPSPMPFTNEEDFL
ncbi:MAG: hypothetical protein F4X98_16860 [Gammaproteobacteria bacterium]|nr:hypothetical protein [Gammaproteobacteria bacterium]